uniref:T-complex 11 n=1 Tax=Plectus sambesii TaxID=2011161 RepID=A0A914XF29_9BILA
MSSNKDVVEVGEEADQLNAEKEDNRQEDKDSADANTASSNIPTDGSVAGASQKRKRSNSDSAPTNIPESTAQSSIPHWLAGASPPRFLGLEELVRTADGLDKMTLVHEMAVNPSFRIEAPTPVEGSLHQKVRDAMHRAFWTALADDLKQTPPNYEHAFALLVEIRELLMSLLLPQHTRLREEIEEHLDLKLLQQQCDHNCLDCLSVANYVLSVMAKLCAPIRDAKIAELKNETDLVALFRGVLETLDLMKVDMANFAVAQNRDVIQMHSAQYEREKFQAYLDATPDGMRHTDSWLRGAFNSWIASRATSPTAQPPAVKRAPATEGSEASTSAPSATSASSQELSRADKNEIISEACFSLLEWDDSRSFPETLLVDQARLYDMRNKCLQLVIATSAVMITSNLAGRDVAEFSDFKKTLKEHLLIILEECDDRKLVELLPNVAEQCVKDVDDVMKNFPDAPAWTSTRATELKAQLMELSRPEQPVRKIIRDRIRSFVLSVTTNPGTSPIKLPPGLGVVQADLARLAGQYLRLIAHNREVFFGLYGEVLERLWSAHRL